jgi:5-dehydro-4-deoxyglucarate dehydratase
MDAFVTPLYAFRARRKGYEVSVMKEMMNLLGMAAGPVRPPLADVRKEEIAELKTMLDAWKPWL